MLLGYEMAFSHLLNDYSTKAVTDENQWPIFRILLLPRLRLVILNLYLGGYSPLYVDCPEP